MSNNSQTDELEDLMSQFQKAMDQQKADQESFWSSLSTEDQLKAFCAVVRRIYEGEILDSGTYRHVLYGVFKFGPEAYAAAQDAGYLAIHNSIINEEHLLQDFVKHHELDQDLVDKFIKHRYF